MAEIADVVLALSWPVKAGWTAWMIWVAGHVSLSRRDRRARGPATAAPRPRRPIPGPAPEPARETVSPRLVTPEDLARPVVAAVVAEPLAFDPSHAVIEAFGEPNTELDAFVANLNRIRKSEV